jgi:hypothetical protein
MSVPPSTARLNQYHLAEPYHDARRFASADCGLLGLRSFRCGALGTIDALTPTSRNLARPNVHCLSKCLPGCPRRRTSRNAVGMFSKGWEQTFRSAASSGIIRSSAPPVCSPLLVRLSSVQIRGRVTDDRDDARPMCVQSALSSRG